MQHDSDTLHVVKAFLPCEIHHALHALLVARHETWQEWLLRKAVDDLTVEHATRVPLPGARAYA